MTQRLGPFAEPDWNDREEAQKRNAVIKSAENELRAWLDANYPDWHSPVAYWD